MLGPVDTPAPAEVGDAALIDALHRHWGIDVAPSGLRYAPKGFGSFHWKARGSDGTRYYLTVDDLDTKPWLGADPDTTFAGLLGAYGAAHALRNMAGLDFVVAPLADEDGRCAVRVLPGYSMAVFRFVDGASGTWGVAPDAAHQAELLRRLAAMHEATGVAAALAPRVGLDLPGRDGLHTALAALDVAWSGGPFSEAVRRALARNTDRIERWLAAYDELHTEVASRGGSAVITHGEPHPGNVMRTAVTEAGGGIALIDWDTAGLAPAERDLWMAADAPGGDLTPYVEVTGRPPDPATMAFFRLRWVLADVAAFIHTLRGPHERNRTTEKEWDGLAGYLDGRVAGPHGPWPEWLWRL